MSQRSAIKLKRHSVHETVESAPTTGTKRHADADGANSPVKKRTKNIIIDKSGPAASAHDCYCDGCLKGPERFSKNRYRCTICQDYDLCETCYMKNVHDLSHRFQLLVHPESDAIMLALRTPPPGTTHPSASPVSLAPHAIANAVSPLLYNEISVGDLQKYLRQNGVDYSNIPDREALRQRAWETRCQCMSITEVNNFLAANNISTSDCHDLISRRQKVMDFQPTQVPRIQKDDIVAHTKLKDAGMNGKQAKVVEPDCGRGRAKVCIEESGETFNVKLENLVVIHDLDNDLD